MPDGTHLLSLVDTSESLRAILDDVQVVAAGDLQDGIQIRHDPVEVNHENRPCPGGDLPFEIGRLYGVIVPVDISKDRNGPGKEDAEGGRDKRIGGDDHLVPRSQVESRQRHVQRCRPAAGTDGMTGPVPLPETALELHPPRAGPVVDLPALQDGADLFQNGEVELGPGRNRTLPDRFSPLQGQFLLPLAHLSPFPPCRGVPLGRSARPDNPCFKGESPPRSFPSLMRHRPLPRPAYSRGPPLPTLPPVSSPEPSG